MAVEGESLVEIGERRKVEGGRMERIRTMFQLAQSDLASTRRILANHEEVGRLGDGPSGQEMVGKER